MGNPSDGFHGKTIAMTIANFWAEVTIVESDKLVSRIIPWSASEHAGLPLPVFSLNLNKVQTVYKKDHSYNRAKILDQPLLLLSQSDFFHN